MRVRLFIALILVLVFSLADRTLVLADSGEVPLEKQAPLPVGTVINTQNWQEYKDYMPLWMQILFAGQYAYKLAPDQQVVVGPTTKVVLPKEYVKNTEKYSSQVSLKVLPDGGTLIQNYTAGIPFPHLSEPNLGDKILWNLWYRYTPRIEVNHADQQALVDKYHQIFTQLLFATYMRLGHVSEPGVPIYDPTVPGTDYAIYAQITEPEQSKYTVSLLIYFLDPTRLQENWSFVPSLRRPLRLSASARCSPAVGTDLVVEDQKQGFNSLITENNGKVVARKMTLEMNNMQPPYPGPPIDFFDPNTLHLWGADRGVGWPPASSKWELRDTWVLEVRRVPDKLAGYCFSKKTLYVDAADYRLGGQEQYDMGGKLWKLLILVSRMAPNSYGDWFDTGTTHYIFIALDLQNVHMTLASQEGPGNGGENNGDVDRQFWDPNRYASPSGLLEIMK
jgi:Protein of unknown function (DUF1329)